MDFEIGRAEEVNWLTWRKMDGGKATNLKCDQLWCREIIPFHCSHNINKIYDKTFFLNKILIMFLIKNIKTLLAALVYLQNMFVFWAHQFFKCALKV